jgi:chromosome segregation ATPase
MYVALGFCLAGLLSVALMPTVWRRAVRLTRAAVEATTPMTHADVRGEIAGLRARHAVEYRKLEAGLERLQQQATENRIARDRAEALANDLRAEFRAKDQALGDAMAREEDLRREIHDGGEALARAKARIRELERSLKRLMAAAETATAGKADGEEAAAEGGMPTLVAVPSAVVVPQPVSQAGDLTGDQAGEDPMGRASELAKVTALEVEIAALKRRLKRAEERAAQSGEAGDAAAEPASVGARSAGLSRQELRARDDRLFEAESRLIAAQAEITRLSVLAEGAQGDETLAGETARLRTENERLRAELRGNDDFLALRSELAGLAASVAASLGTDEDLAPVLQAVADAEQVSAAEGERASGSAVTQSLAARIRAVRERKSQAGDGAPTPPEAPKRATRSKAKAGG